MLLGNGGKGEGSTDQPLDGLLRQGRVCGVSCEGAFRLLGRERNC